MQSELRSRWFCVIKCDEALDHGLLKGNPQCLSEIAYRGRRQSRRQGLELVDQPATADGPSGGELDQL
jgi:hypothetical protein